MPKTAIILGSSRSNGNTYKIVQHLRTLIEADLIDLNDYTMSAYDYDSKNQYDDFLPLMRKLVENYDTLIFATPVYWYTMSATMKIFFDRISDCLRIDKDTGRKLRGKKMAAICCGSEPSPTPAFFTPFKLSADYLGMDYLGDVHTWIEEETISTEVLEVLKGFVKKKL